MRKTKIIATIGPAVLKGRGLEDLILAGADVLRLNFSHLTKVEASKQLKAIHRAERRVGARVGILVDLKGPEIRTDTNSYTVSAGKKYWLATKGNPEKGEIGIDHPALYKLIKKGQRISMEDGHYQMEVLRVEKNKIEVQCFSSGSMKPRRAVSLPRVDLKLPVVSENDKAALRFVQEEEVHWVAASFINRASDVEKIRSILQQQGKNVAIISKIETFTAIQNIDEIIDVSDGIMVARGDLGVDFDYEEIPILQDLVINKTKEKGKVIIVATQMLESMMKFTLPRRAEVTDIAIATREKVDAVMLSGETASGKYPAEAVTVMSRIVRRTEQVKSSQNLQTFKTQSRILDLCRSALNLAQSSKSSNLVCITKKGRSPKVIAAHRPDIVSLVAAKDPEVYGRCKLYYSICPVDFGSKKIPMGQISEIMKLLKKKKFIAVGEKIVFIFSLALEEKMKFLKAPRRKTKGLATNCILLLDVK